MHKILVIEDEAPIRETIVDLLEVKDFQVLAAQDGLVGLQLAREQLPDLIICDVMMPHLDGYGVLTALRADLTTATIPFLFLTARATWADLRQGMALGADNYLIKPFTQKELLEAIAVQTQKQKVAVERSERKLEELRLSIIYALPHELLTPLSGILGIAEWLREEHENLSPTEILLLSENLRISADRLHRLLRNFLAYTQLELLARDEQMDESFCDSRTTGLGPLVSKVARRIALQYQRAADLRIEIAEANLRMGEENFCKLVEELVDNAFKFSPEKTLVSVRATVENGCLHLQIADRGRGMAAEQVAKISACLQFERRLHEQQGFGLGLAIARHLSQLHAGSLTVTSTPGVGTSVDVVLPCWS